MPVETYDERFTSSLAGGDDARAAAYLLSSYLEWLGNRDGRRPRSIRRRRIVAVLALRSLVIAAVAGVSVAAVRHHTTKAAPTTTARFRRRRSRSTSSSRRASPARRWRDRVKVVAKIARRKHHASVRLEPDGLPRRQRTRGRPVLRPQARRTNLEGFLFPATYEFLQADDLAAARARADQGVLPQLAARSTSRYARSKNLTPYDVLTIASMVEKEATVPAERRLVAAVIYNRLHNRMPLGIDATLRYGLHIPPTESITRVASSQSPNPYNTRRFVGPAADADREPGARRRCRRPRIRRSVDYLYFVRKPDHKHHFFTASASAFDEYLATHGYG